MAQLFLEKGGLVREKKIMKKNLELWSLVAASRHVISDNGEKAERKNQTKNAADIQVKNNRGAQGELARRHLEIIRH